MNLRICFCWIIIVYMMSCASTSIVDKTQVTQDQQTVLPPLLITNVRVFDQTASTVVVHNGMIVAVGDASVQTQMAPAWGPPIRIDGRDGLLLPGFHDAHIHLLSGGFSLTALSMNEETTLEDVLSKLRAYVILHPEMSWITGRGWSYNITPRGTFPSRFDIDKIESKRPVWLRAYDGHTGWANTQAMIEAGLLDKNGLPITGIAYPAGVVLDEQGVPTGIIKEDAMSAVMLKVPTKTAEEKKAALVAAVEHLVQLGVTAVDAIEGELDVMEILIALEKEGRLPLRITLAFPLEEKWEEYKRLKSLETSKVQFRFLKAFIDGVFESHTAHNLEPYPGTQDYGKSLLTPAELERLTLKAQTEGFQVAVHAIGDAAVRNCLDVFSKASQVPNILPMRHRIEHIELLSFDDLARFHNHGIIASMQPYHAIPDGEKPEEGAWGAAVGVARLPRTFPWRSLLDARAPLAFGSDWPVFTANPLHGLFMALRRQNSEMQPAKGFIPEQRITPREAVAAYTLERAETYGISSSVGRIAEGQKADFVILDPSVSFDEPQTLLTGKAQYVVVDGVPWVTEGVISDKISLSQENETQLKNTVRQSADVAPVQNDAVEDAAGAQSTQIKP
jgi:predicted amidohydrolase YtcJ